MTPSHQTVVNEEGFFFQLPKLGLNEPAVGWATMKAGIGTKEAVSALIDANAPTPLRTPEGEHRVMEIEWQGYVWFLPFLNNPPHKPQPSPDVFTINVRRALKATVSNGVQRREIDMGPEYRNFFLVDPNPDKGNAPEWPPLPTAKDASWEKSKLIQTCLNPGPEHCKEKSKVHGQKVEEKVGEAKERKQMEKAWKRWAAMQLDEVNEEWLREVHRSAVAAGMRKKTSAFKKDEPLVRLRPHAAPFFEVTQLEYAICDSDGAVSDNANWKALPANAYSQDFVRCTINLVRLECRKRLFARAEWPLRAAH